MGLSPSLLLIEWDILALFQGLRKNGARIMSELLTCI